MAWLDRVLTELADATAWGYLPGGAAAAEPAALSALALASHGRRAAARAPLDWLCTQQSADGRVGAVAGDSDPAWPTAWAVLAWQTAGAQEPASSPGERYQPAIKRGIAWLLEARGTPLQKSADIGHDPTLVGWPWVLSTHSWVEPTAMAVLSLKATGRARDPRCVEGIRLLHDRLLPAGGCNYGNTEVLGQFLRPHVEPTGVCLWALAGEPDADGRTRRSLDYLRSELPRQQAAISLSYGLIGLAAHGVLLVEAESLLAAAAGRTLRRAPVAYRLALLALAAKHALPAPVSLSGLSAPTRHHSFPAVSLP